MSKKKVYKKIRTKKAYKNKKKVYESLSANKKQKEYERKKVYKSNLV